MTRQPYPSDASDEAWSVVAPSLTFITEDAPQRDHALPTDLPRGLPFRSRDVALQRLY